MNYGLGTWTRTKINGFKGRCATDCTIPKPRDFNHWTLQLLVQVASGMPQATSRESRHCNAGTQELSCSGVVTLRGLMLDPWDKAREPALSPRKYNCR